MGIKSFWALAVHKTLAVLNDASWHCSASTPGVPSVVGRLSKANVSARHLLHKLQMWYFCRMGKEAKNPKETKKPSALRVRRTVTQAKLEANRANAKLGGRPPGSMSPIKRDLAERCRVNHERHVEILEHIAQFSTNEGFRLTAIRDLMDRGHGRPRQAIEGSGGGRSSAMSRRMSANRFRGTATSAIWNAHSAHG